MIFLVKSIIYYSRKNYLVRNGLIRITKCITYKGHCSFYNPLNFSDTLAHVIHDSVSGGSGVD